MLLYSNIWCNFAVKCVIVSGALKRSAKMVHSDKLVGGYLPVEGCVKLGNMTPSWSHIFRA